MFAQCFPANIMMSDIDAEVEMKGHWLRLEWKAADTSLPQGQRINYQRLTGLCHHIVLVVNGDAELMTVANVNMWANGKETTGVCNSLDELKALLVRWAIWADK